MGDRAGKEEAQLIAILQGLRLELIGNDYLVVGTVDWPVWKRGTQGDLTIQEMLDNLHDFKDHLQFKLAPRWAPP